MTQNIILTNAEIGYKIKRISYQIYETFANENEIILAGIANNGFLLTQKIAIELQQISNLKITLCEVYINKQNLLDTIKTSLPTNDYQNKSVVLIDDVLNSGATLIYAVKHFLNVPIKSLKTAVLIDRNHKKFPIKADFKGLSLSTSSHNHVAVVFNKDLVTAILS